MAFGLEVITAGGKSQVAAGGRLARLGALYNVSIAYLYSGNYQNTFSCPGMVDDGTWFVYARVKEGFLQTGPTTVTINNGSFSVKTSIVAYQAGTMTYAAFKY